MTIILGLIVGLVIGWCLGISTREPDTIGSLSFEVERVKRQEAEYKLRLAEEEIRRGGCRIGHHYFPYMCPQCHPHYLCYIHNKHVCDKKFYAVDKERQDLVDIITKGKKIAAQLVKDLNLETPEL